MSILDNIKKTPISLKPNYYHIPVTAYSFTEEGVEKFNEIYLYLDEYCKDFNPIKRTKSKGISIDHIRLPQWDVRALKSCVELTVLCIEGMFRIQLRTSATDEDKRVISGSKCFKIFKSICDKFNINLEEFAVENGKEYKDQIVQPPIRLYKQWYKDRVFYHVHHIDLNSSYFAGIAEAYPGLKEPIEYIYSMRKQNQIYKDILTHTQGYMQSEMVNYRFANLSKAGIDSNNRKIHDLSNQLISRGFVILAYNTDGIWYTHPEGKEYHDEYEGTGLGQWKHDHLDTTWQAKSNGAYHYLEHGICTTVLRGRTRLDRVKKREDWTWDDLYNADTEVMKVKFLEHKGAWIVYEQDAEL